MASSKSLFTHTSEFLRRYLFVSLFVLCIFRQITREGTPVEFWNFIILLSLMLWFGYIGPTPITLKPDAVALLVFAGALWFSPTAAAWASLICFYLLSRISLPKGMSPSAVRYRGAQFALLAISVSLVEHLAIHYRYIRVPMVAWITASVVGIVIELFRSPELGHYPRRYVGERWFMPVCIGMPGIVLLTPLYHKFGALTCVALLLLILLAERASRQMSEMNTLRKQLQAAEEMGRASVSCAENSNSIALLQCFLKLAHDLTPSVRSLVWILDPESGELQPAVSLPDAGPFTHRVTRFGEGLVGHAASRVRPRIIPDAATDIYRAHHEEASGAWLLYPIVVNGEMLGVAHWIRPTSRPFLPEDVSRLDALVPQATIALENIQNRTQLQAVADTDGLTGLSNQRHTGQLLRDELRRSNRYQRPLSILMLDIDSFKSFNDSYGHPAGDRLLGTVAGVLRSTIRSVDYVGRFGGEEFLIILPETSKDTACQLAERVRNAVEERAFVIVEGIQIRRTISIGVAAYPEDALNVNDLLQRADEALYRAKRSGKNCVTWA